MPIPIAQDMPDDWPWLPGSSRFPVGDLGELAARMGSPVTYDRRGEVVWFETVSHGASDFDEINMNAGATYKITPAKALRSGYSFLVAVSATPGTYGQIHHYETFQNSNSMGLEEVFFIGAGTNYHALIVDYYNGTQHAMAMVTLDNVGNTIKYKNSAGADVICYSNGATFNSLLRRKHLKMVIDCVTLTYKRILYNNLVIDLSGVPLYVTASTAEPFIDCRIFHTGNALAAESWYHNATILTLNEP
jgi:hypothetical protein